MDSPAGEPPPWGALLEDAREHLDISQNEAARRAGISGARWRQIVSGSTGAMTSNRGRRTVTRMAQVVGVTADQMRAAGRDDVAAGLVGHPEDQATVAWDALLASIERIRADPVRRRRLEAFIEGLDPGQADVG